MSLMDKDLEQLVAGSNYKFSATKIDNLGSSEYTLVTIICDASSSVAGFSKALETALKTVFKSCWSSDRKNQLMLRLTQFSDKLTELHGFRLLSTITEDDYNGILQIGGMTALFDGTDEGISATAAYGKTLMDKDFTANAILFIITDGENNQGKIREPAPIKKSLEKARSAETLESIRTVLVGVTNDDVNLGQYLQDFKDQAGLDQYISIGKASPGKLAKLADFVSQSISSTSTALGSGQPSQPIDPKAFAI